MGMFQPRDKLRFAFKPTDKIRLVRQSRQNDLYRDFTPDCALIGPIDGTEATRPDSLA